VVLVSTAGVTPLVVPWSVVVDVPVVEPMAIVVVAPARAPVAMFTVLMFPVVVAPAAKP
jgi:hypothetical protein